jgi:hypothetical protein
MFEEKDEKIFSKEGKKLTCELTRGLFVCLKSRWFICWITRPF